MKIFLKINKVDVLIIGDLCKKIRYLTTNIKEIAKLGQWKKKTFSHEFYLHKLVREKIYLSKK